MGEISNSVKAATTDIGALIQERDQLRTRNAELEAKVERLRKAIATHKNNVWGRHEVAHNEDVVLYAALEASE